MSGSTASAGRVDGLSRLVEALGVWAATSRRALLWMRFVPTLRPQRRQRLYGPVREPWPEFRQPAPAGLRGRPGIERDPAVEDSAAERDPLPVFSKRYAAGVDQIQSHLWRATLPLAPALVRAALRAKRGGRPSAAAAAPTGAAELTAALRSRAASLGLSAIGVARYDARYTFEPFRRRAVGDRVVVCALEQNFAATQQIPSLRSEKSALLASAECMRLAEELSAFLRQRGYRAHTSNPEGYGVMIHYAVEAGLGQLGLNGQLLTPAAGSRCRLVTISTDAPLELDAPRDFGIERICDGCKACVRRCPSGAIPAQRRPHRGVVKAKINTARCLPVVAQASGCAVCMKVCPVQRFGLAAIYAEYERTGSILGVETADLESYVWPLDGRLYAPPSRPKLARDFFFDIGGGPTGGGEAP